MCCMLGQPCRQHPPTGYAWVRMCGGQGLEPTYCLLLDHLLPVCGVLHARVNVWMAVVGQYMKKLTGRLTPAP